MNKACRHSKDVYNRIDKQIILYYLQKNKVPVSSKSYRYVKLLLLRSNFNCLNISKIARFNFRLLRFANVHNELTSYDSSISGFLNDLNLEYYRRNLLSSIHLPQVQLSDYCTESLNLDKFEGSKEYKRFLTNALRIFVLTDKVSLLNLRVFEDLVIDHLRENCKTDIIHKRIQQALNLFRILYEIYINRVLREDDF